ncbi:MAG: hypothetical protein P8J87_03675 [Verrucomicrobiales bacterium]|nr:hypothetical protein [Verrucomicrobiales bacterium]
MDKPGWSWWQWALLWLAPVYHLVWGSFWYAGSEEKWESIPYLVEMVIGFGLYGTMGWSVVLVVALIRSSRTGWILGAFAVTWVELIFLFRNEI